MSDSPENLDPLNERPTHAHAANPRATDDDNKDQGAYYRRPAPSPHESTLLRLGWMLVFVLVWQVAQFLLGALVVVQLIYRMVYSAPNAALMNFGDSLSQYLAQIGRFGSFHTDQKPWPFTDWPVARAPDGEQPHTPSTARGQAPKP